MNGDAGPLPAGLTRLPCPGRDPHALLDSGGGEQVARSFEHVQLCLGRGAGLGEGLLLITTRHALGQQPAARAVGLHR